ncbi:MAG TPA: acyltransferase family protein [Candidatus Saccharimonadia bacterium]|nr:acyltransferase family protein [Candidatus Saccharimonadia bacterium]
MSTDREVNQFDIARIAGAAAVVMIHVSAAGVLAFGLIGIKEWWLSNILDSVCRWAVPVFIMVSGALLLDPSTPRPFFSFMRRRVSRIIPPLLFWSALYFVWLSWWRLTPINLHYVISAFLSGNPYDHLYFLPLILGLYLITPMLRIYVMHASRQNAYYCLLVIFLLAAANDYISTFWGFGGVQNIATQFLPYIGYFLAGYYLKNLALTLRGKRLPLPIFVLSSMVTAIGCYALSAAHGIEKGVYFYDYTSVTVIIASLALFVWFDNIRMGATRWWLTPRSRTVIKTLSTASFGIYLIHPILLDILSSAGISPVNMYLPLGIFFQFSLALISASAIVICMLWVPWLRAVVS